MAKKTNQDAIEPKQCAAIVPVQHIFDELNKTMAAALKPAGEALEEVQKNISASFEPIRKDSERAKKLIKWFDDSQGDAGLPDLQALIDSGGPLTAAQVLFLILEARNIDSAPIAEAFKAEQSRRALMAIKKRHSQPGGSDETKRKMLEAWAGGQYTSRDQCAESMYQSLGISYAAARKKLRNSPDPKKGA